MFLDVFHNMDVIGMQSAYICVYFVYELHM